MPQPFCKSTVVGCDLTSWRHAEAIRSLQRQGREFGLQLEVIAHQKALVEELRTDALLAVQVRDEAIRLVKKAIVAIHALENREAQAKEALQEERSEREQVNEEIASISQQVSELIKALP